MLENLKCLRCGGAMVDKGEFSLMKGTNWSAVGGILGPFVEFEKVNLYHCRSCASVELFSSEVLREGDAGEFIQPYNPGPTGLTWRCVCGELNLRSAERCRNCDKLGPEKIIPD